MYDACTVIINIIHNVSALCSLLTLFCISQLPCLSLWNSKEGTVQTSLPSSVDTEMFLLTQTGYTMGQQRVVNS